MCIKIKINTLILPFTPPPLGLVLVFWGVKKNWVFFWGGFKFWWSRFFGVLEVKFEYL